MAEVLRGEELIFGRKGTVDLADIESAPFGARRRIEVGGLVGERNHRFALRERGNGPIRQQGEETGSGESSAHRFAPGNVFEHTPSSISSIRVFYLSPRIARKYFASPRRASNPVCSGHGGMRNDQCRELV